MTDSPITEFWLKNYVRRGMCSLCGQSGIIDTRATAISTIGIRCGDVHFCICPNGQSMKRTGRPATWWQERAWKVSQQEEER